MIAKDPVKLGSFLKDLRNKKNLTMVELAEKIGISQSYLSQIEAGKKGIPKPELLDKFAESLNEDYNFLLYKAGHIGIKVNNEENLSEEEKDEKVKETFLSYPKGYDVFDAFFQAGPRAKLELILPIEYVAEDDNGVEYLVRSKTQEELKSWIFDLYYLPRMYMNLYYKGVPLNKEQKEKLKAMLKVLFE